MTEVVAVVETENESDHYPVEAPGVIVAVVAKVKVEINVTVDQEVGVVQK